MLRLRAPAKLNLYLRVLGKRPDGYHELETLFERIDLADELTFEAHPHEVQLTCSDPTLSCGEDNLVLKAARALQRQSGTQHGARIQLTKRIPIAAGLGGGSSDAATTLLGLNGLWRLHLKHATLAELAATLGSDVPFFLSNASYAVGRGRGERCEALPQIARLSHILVVPNATLSTKDVYGGADFSLTASKPSITIALHALRNGPALAGLAEGLWNDLEPEAIRRCPVIARIQSALRESGCIGVRMSGSGPSVFGLCRDALHASEIASKIRAASPSSWRIDIIQTDQPSTRMHTVPS
ncbi:MAG: 4-(cytidine 5'-diphospho)-2-C-methyl-D-erythritol kinase [Candidatus Omnitrophica bacterium]|nr:4-(cytidine 5'-diphospho)-2-C-methyl-D-erythritol kinase [Candidatus Omnitrophota bacterium]